MIKLFDSHCHLQDPRILNVAPKLIKEAIDAGVVHFAVNGVSEKDWHLVKQMSDRYPSVIPNFGLHPWFISDRTPNWLETLKEFLTANPSAAVGEIGLDKGSIGKQIDFTDQVEIFRQQLLLAKEVQRPASVHCVRAFGDLLEILKSVGPFSSGVILHSYLGSAEMVPQLSDLGAYFSFSGFLMSMKESKAKRMLKSVPIERILLETDTPDARPKSVNPGSLFLVEREVFNSDENISSSSGVENVSRDEIEESGNHPANIHHVLAYVARLLEMEERELAELSYQNAVLLLHAQRYECCCVATTMKLLTVRHPGPNPKEEVLWPYNYPKTVGFFIFEEDVIRGRTSEAEDLNPMLLEMDTTIAELEYEKEELLNEVKKLKEKSWNFEQEMKSEFARMHSRMMNYPNLVHNLALALVVTWI